MTVESTIIILILVVIGSAVAICTSIETASKSADQSAIMIASMLRDAGSNIEYAIQGRAGQNAILSIVATIDAMTPGAPHLPQLADVGCSASKMRPFVPVLFCQAKILANSCQPSDSTQNRVFPKVRECPLDFAILKVEPIK